ncbi:TetR/AcrR family transcriptional regulator [Paenibacillus sp. PAMC21692]|uniref:TetR/AcrR family transcriptional regulator n=1 Tax=Paenibacillus sp. PAMC21692 TaxID=2762320 RepID=UPI0021C358AC|nr:TetR/AcrR family transcriptional regulator [Paenibacillus sp. PAMC21692]
MLNIVPYSTNMTPTKRTKSNREIALEAASHLFLTRGVAVTSMDDIVAYSHVSKTNIYYYFKSKEELLLTIVDGLTSHYERRLAAILAEEELSVYDKLERVVRALSLENENNDYLGGCPFLTLYVQTAGEYPAAKEKFRLFFAGQLSSLEALLLDGIGRGELRRELPAHATAAMIVSVIEGGLFVGQSTGMNGILKDVLPALALLLK